MGKASRAGRAKTPAKAVSSRLVKHAPLTTSGAKILASTKSQTTGENEALSRGQRKRLAKREQFLKRERMVMSSLRLKKLEEQKGKLDGLDAIKEALTSTTSTAKDAQSSTHHAINQLSSQTVKAKKNLANSEIGHMGLVLEHPSFQENPFAAIQQHLRNSLESDAEMLKEESLKREKEDKLIEHKKKEEKKEKIRDIRFARRMGSKKFKSNRAKRL
mmetsp:Transcript_7391/g.12277  ORF Transcript_7391/g.12277 Transcript_7391/m.12277 type:complete len:217 (+) Transcript_7391:110-760(+)|eukprot:scaffold3197_cov153-Skeletonema_menzelii.AAC.6